MLAKKFMNMFSMPNVMSRSTALFMDTLGRTHYYNPTEAGDPSLWHQLC